MEKQYYTPTIEEFHAGFEYEQNYEIVLTIEERIKQESPWYPKVFKISDYEFIEHLIKTEFVRVKYLDKKDIESLGFIKSYKDQWIGWKDYYLNELPGSYGYFLYATLHFPRNYCKTNRLEDNQFKIIVHRYYYSDEEETTNIDDCLDQNESEIIYKGLIKNKSELKTLMKQLNII